MFLPSNIISKMKIEHNQAFLNAGITFFCKNNIRFLFKGQLYLTIFTLFFIFGTIETVHAQFTPGRIVVVQTTGSTSKVSSSIVLQEYLTSGGPATTSVALPTSNSTPLEMAAGAGGSEGFLTTSTDGKYLVLGGYLSDTSAVDITSTLSSKVPRAIFKVDASGTPSLVASSTTNYNANDIRGAVSDGTNFWASGASVASVDGIDYYGPGTQVALGTGTTPVKAYGLRIFNGQIYYSTQKAGPANTASNLGIFALGTGLPTTGNPSSTQIINVGTSTPADFSFGPGDSLCYIAINLNTAAGGIQKWTKHLGVWTLAYTLGTGVTNVGAYGLVVDYSGTSPVLYATTSESNTVGNRIIQITDNGAASAAVLIAPAVADTWFHGISFTPCPLPVNPSASGNSIICSGNNLMLTSSVTGNVSYSWSGPNDFTSAMQNPSINNITVAASGSYTVTFSNSCGNASASTSVTVNPSPVKYNVTGGGNYCSNASGLVIGLDNSDTGINYQLINRSGSIGTSVAGNSGNAITFGLQTTANADTFSVVATDVANSCFDTTMSGATIITAIPSVTPSVSITGNPGNSICAGTSVTFTALPVNGGKPSYQWTKNGSPVGLDNVTYTDPSLVDNDEVFCTMTSTAICATINTAVSSTIDMIVNTLPTPVITGVLSFCYGGNTTLDAGSGYASYLWNTTDVTESISASTGGSYSVTVSDGTCSGSSSPVMVTVNNNPATPTITQNGDVLSSSATSGNQWYLDGSLIAGATSQQYTPVLSGNYTVISTDGNNCISNASPVVAVTIATTSISSGIIEPGSLTVFPNPFSNQLTLKYYLDNSSVVNIELIDITGKQIAILVNQETENSGDHQININAAGYSLQSGLYMIRFITNTGSQVVKVNFVQ